MFRPARLAVLALLASSLLALSSARAAPATTVLRNPVWAGYAVGSLTAPKPGSITVVSGEWIVPTLNCGGGYGQVSQIVAMDGFGKGDTSVEEVGATEKCIKGQASYGAWYRVSPHAPVAFSVAVLPGHTVYGEVRVLTSEQMRLTFTDLSTAKIYDAVVINTAKHASAEWVLSAVPAKRGTLPLANFGAVQFKNCSLYDNGFESTIGTGGHGYDTLKMVTNRRVRATATVLDPSMAGFVVTWVHR